MGMPRSCWESKGDFSELCTHAVILSEARSAKSKDLRTYPLHSKTECEDPSTSLPLVATLRMTKLLEI